MAFCKMSGCHTCVLTPTWVSSAVLTAYRWLRQQRKRVTYRCDVMVWGDRPPLLHGEFRDKKAPEHWCKRNSKGKSCYDSVINSWFQRSVIEHALFEEVHEMAVVFGHWWKRIYLNTSAAGKYDEAVRSSSWQGISIWIFAFWHVGLEQQLGNLTI